MHRVLCVLCVLSATVEAAPLEDWLGAPYTASVATAARSGRVAYVMSERGARNVYVADPPAYVPRQVTRFTEDDGRLITGLTLAPDGRTAVYAYGNGPSENGNVNPRSEVAPRTQQIIALDLATGAPRAIADSVEGKCGSPDGCSQIAVSPDGDHVAITGARGLRIARLTSDKPLAIELRGGAGDPAWSPDGKTLAFLVWRSGHSMIALYRIGDAAIRYVAPSFDDDVRPSWSRDGKRLAFVRVSSQPSDAPLLAPRIEPWSIWIADAATLAAREVWRSGTTERDSLPDNFEQEAFGFGAGGWLYFLSERDGWAHLYALDSDRRGAQPRLLTPGDFEVAEIVPSRDGTSLVYSSNQGDLDRRHIWQVGLASGTAQPLTRGDGIEARPVVTGDGKIFCLAGTAQQPMMVTPVTGQGLGRAISLDAWPARSPLRKVAAPSTITYRSADGVQVHAQLLAPAGGGRHPAVVFLHGGPVRQLFPGFHPMDYYHDTYIVTQYLASRGFVVLSINYRGGVGYGRAFREPAGLGMRGASEYQDVRAAALYLRSLASVDPQRVALWGGSYGGFLTALGLGRDPDVFAAGVSYAGVTDWWARYGYESSPAPDRAAAKALAFASGPMASVGTWRAPVLIIHGDDDANVEFAQSIALVRALARRGVRVEQMALPDQTHFMAPWSLWLKTYRATTEFLERELRPTKPR